MTDLEWTTPAPDATRPERKPARCRHHVVVGVHFATDGTGYWHAEQDDSGAHCEPGVICVHCYKRIDKTASRRGRNNRKRGVSDELAVARILGGRKVGPLGLPWDVVIEGYLRAQCKKTGRWPSLASVVTWLDAIPAGPELRAVTLADTPGPGGRTRRLIVLDLEEFARWHGGTR